MKNDVEKNCTFSRMKRLFLVKRGQSKAENEIKIQQEGCHPEFHFMKHNPNNG